MRGRCLYLRNPALKHFVLPLRVGLSDPTCLQHVHVLENVRRYR